MGVQGRRREDHFSWRIHARAEDRGHMYQAGRDQRVTVYVHGNRSQYLPTEGLRGVLASLHVLLQLIDAAAFVIGVMIVAMAIWDAPFSTLSFEGGGTVGGSLALMMLVERLFTGRQHRWSRPRRRVQKA